MGAAVRFLSDTLRICLFDPLRLPSAPIRPTSAPTVPQGLGRVYLFILLFILLSFLTAPHAPLLRTQHLYARAPAHLRTRSHAPARPRTLSVWCFEFWGGPKKHPRGRILPASNEVFTSGARSGADSVKGCQERQSTLLACQSAYTLPSRFRAMKTGTVGPRRAAGC